MQLLIKLFKPLHQSASDYFNNAKEVKKRIEGATIAIIQTEKEIEKESKLHAQAQKNVKVKREKKWFEKFHWFYTSQNRLAVGGRSAQENDRVFKTYMEDNDLFFHAEIQGGSAIILKDGINASEEEKKEVAQFAASMSNAWKNANASVDVYAAKKDQISKASHGGFIQAGQFAITGEREWFRNVPLGIIIGKGPEGLECVPSNSKRKIEKPTHLVPSRTGKEKGGIASSLAKYYDTHPDFLLELLPNGKSRSKQ